MANLRALEEYNRMHSESKLIVHNSEDNPYHLQVTLLNIRSFNKHVIDLGSFKCSSQEKTRKV